MSPCATIAIKTATTGAGFLFLWWQNVNSYPNPMFSPLDCFLSQCYLNAVSVLTLIFLLFILFLIFDKTKNLQN